MASQMASAQNMLALQMCMDFPEIETAYVWMAVHRGNVEALYYSADGVSEPQLETTYTNGVLDVTADVDWKTGICTWNDNNAGVTSGGRIVGTSPKLSVGTP